MGGRVGSCSEGEEGARLQWEWERGVVKGVGARGINECKIEGQ